MPNCKRGGCLAHSHEDKVSACDNGQNYCCLCQEPEYYLNLSKKAFSTLLGKARALAKRDRFDWVRDRLSHSPTIVVQLERHIDANAPADSSSMLPPEPTAKRCRTSAAAALPGTTAKRCVAADNAPGAGLGVRPLPTTPIGAFPEQSWQCTQPTAVAVRAESQAPETPPEAARHPYSAEPPTPDAAHPMTPDGANLAGRRVPRTPLPSDNWYFPPVLQQPKLALCSRYSLAPVCSGIGVMKYQRVLEPAEFLQSWLAQRGRICAQWPRDAAEAFGVFRMLPPQVSEVLHFKLVVTRLRDFGDVRRTLAHWQGIPRVVVVARMQEYHSCTDLHTMVVTAALDDRLMCTNSWGANQPLVEVSRMRFESAWLVDLECVSREVGTPPHYQDVAPAMQLMPISRGWEQLASANGPWKSPQ